MTTQALKNRITQCLPEYPAFTQLKSLDETNPKGHLMKRVLNAEVNYGRMQINMCNLCDPKVTKYQYREYSVLVSS